ncbi:hypothetical protein [Brevundimonas aurifodinae]|uniref:Uncharacterized protein n=2 Tax=Brevundimonas TaxID=41275 RepID=A0ABV1NN59_9CAUL|nr:MAG: hypothetical protein B7Z42_14585 [Brevundimonas sp. 12-68-7]OYX30377.1 MAG: hypothetical protein B7Z01_14485 [Brevundimonas subvibrioides]
MSELYDPREWEDDDQTPTRAVWHDAQPDTRQRGPQNPGRPPAPRGGYRIRSDETWARARDAYLAGETAEEVAFRFDLTLGSLRHRARQEGWRRADQDDPEWGYRSARGASLLEPGEGRVDDRWGHIGDDEGYAELAERALFQLRRAMAQGRGGAAASWMRVHDRLTARAELEEAREARKATQAAEAARLVAERAAAEVRAATAARAEANHALIRDLGTAARQSASVAPGDAVARAALDAELDRLSRASDALDAAAISHVSDGSHAVSEQEGDP